MILPLNLIVSWQITNFYNLYGLATSTFHDCIFTVLITYMNLGDSWAASDNIDSWWWNFDLGIWYFKPPNK